MARAKRTRRAEARRRYRAEHGLPDDSMAVEDAQGAGAATTGATRQGRPDPGPNERLGIGTSFRLAFRPLDLRGDLRALPRLILNKALWLPVLLTLGATAIFLVVRPQATAPAGDLLAVLSVFVLQYFIQPPAIGGVFIAGFLAPRASWLLGIIVGLVAAVCYAGLILSGALGVGTAAQMNEAILGGFVISPLMGALFASAAAWYRRFLQLSSPNRGRTRPPAKRGNDGRSRAANQKAGVRR